MIEYYVQNWSLQIRGVVTGDEGEYVCQASHHPPANIVTNLIVYGKDLSRILVSIQDLFSLRNKSLNSQHYFHLVQELSPSH